MPGMNGIDVINWIRDFLRTKGVEPEEMPRFAFRGQQFYELPSEIIEQVFKMGFKAEDIIERVVRRTQVEKYFKRIGYYYRQLADE